MYPSSDERINKMWYIHAMALSLSYKLNEALIHATAWMTVKALCWAKEARHKGHVLCNSIYMQCPE